LGCSEDSSDYGPVSDSGKGGSLARYAISENALYVVTEHDLVVFDITDPSGTTHIKSLQIGLDVETIFPYNNFLFIGSQSAMYLYDISDRLDPQYLSGYSHFTSCDPVVVQGDVAYVSLRGRTDCNVGMEDLIEKIDVSNVRFPRNLKTTKNVLSPYGLGVKGDVLFVCQGENGLRLFNANTLTVIRDMDVHAYDVIVDGEYLILTGDEGIYQYDITDEKQPEFLSLITVPVD
jgi:hypothetical protein